MKNSLLIFFFFLFSNAFSQGLSIDDWYLQINTLTPDLNELHPNSDNTDPDNFDYIVGKSYNIYGDVTFSEATPIDGTLNLVFSPSTASTTTYSIKLADVPKGSTGFSIPSLNWNGQVQNFVPITNSDFIVYLQFVSNGPNFNTSNIITFTPRTALSSVGQSSYATCSASVPVSLSVTANGGVGPYTYSWSPTTGLSSTSVNNPIATVSKTTVYTVTITDSSNPLNQTSTKNITVTISSLAAPIISLTTVQSGTWAPCPTGTGGSGGGGQQLEIVKENKLNDSEKISSLDNEGSYPTNTDKTFSIGPGGGSKCIWTASGIPTNATAVNWLVTGLAQGLSLSYIYTGSLKTGLVVTGSFSGTATSFRIACSYSTSTCTSVSTILPVSLCNFLPQSSVYPNPTNMSFSVSINVQDETMYTISVHDAIGSVLSTKDLGILQSGSHEESFNLMQSGIYLVKVFNSNGKVETHRVVVK